MPAIPRRCEAWMPETAQRLLPANTPGASPLLLAPYVFFIPPPAGLPERGQAAFYAYACLKSPQLFSGLFQQKMGL